jgi:hypothetical protein
MECNDRSTTACGVFVLDSAGNPTFLRADIRFIRMDICFLLASVFSDVTMPQEMLRLCTVTIWRRVRFVKCHTHRTNFPAFRIEFNCCEEILTVTQQRHEKFTVNKNILI